MAMRFRWIFLPQVPQEREVGPAMWALSLVPRAGQGQAAAQYSTTRLLVELGGSGVAWPRGQVTVVYAQT
jgi:hypothetical protein